ncbi:MAG: DinB family protein [Bryobacteraceae bacterium]
MRIGLKTSAGVLFLVVNFAAAAPLSELERQRLVAHMQMTESWLADEVAGLSKEQLRFHPARGAWSILEVVEHLVISEPIYWQDFQRAMKTPPSRFKSNAGDDDILWYGIDRTRREKAIPSEDVKGQLQDLSAGLKALRELRAAMLRYVRSTRDDLRSRIVPRQGCDAYQWLLLITSHCQRHILQIREIKSNPGFPKNQLPAARP